MQLPTCPRWAAPLSYFGVLALRLQIVWALVAMLTSASCRPLSDLDSARAGNMPEPGAGGSAGEGAARAPSSDLPLAAAGATDEQADVESSSRLPEGTLPALPGSALSSDATPPDMSSTTPTRPNAALPADGSGGELAASDALDAGRVGTPPSPVLPDAS
jgi:hypothetical protein